MRATLRFLLALPMLLVAAFFALALFYLLPGPPWMATAAAVGFACACVATLLFVRPYPLALGLVALALLALGVWWNGIHPSSDKDWAPDVARMPHGEIAGNVLTLHDVRSFTFRSESDYDVRYDDRSYDLSQITGLDLFLSYWGSPAIAHTILSWEFANGDNLAISIETRKDKAQTYSAVAGFFKQYEIIYVAGDERDLVQLRTNLRGENVFLYRLAAAPARARLLLEDYLAKMNDLARHPAFYNAFTDNCTTSIHTHVRHLNPEGSTLDWRLLVNGYLDEMLYQQGSQNVRLPFPELRSRSSIDSRAKAADGQPDFSARIRDGLPARPPYRG